MSKTMDMSGGAPSLSAVVDLKRVSELLGSTEAELEKFFDVCQKSAIILPLTALWAQGHLGHSTRVQEGAIRRPVAERPPQKNMRKPWRP